VVTSSAIAWTRGNYAQIIPWNVLPTPIWINGIIINNMVIDTEYEVLIGLGGAGSEIGRISVTHETHDSNLSCFIPISPAFKVPANLRVGACCATENAAADTCTIKISYKLFVAANS